MLNVNIHVSVGLDVDIDPKDLRDTKAHVEQIILIVSCINSRYFGVSQTGRDGKRSRKSKDFVRSSVDNTEVFLPVERVWTSSPSETYYKVSSFCRVFVM